ncbi:MAG: HlyC/CorC family transporter [Syntrophomonadaceae bacterium]|nr:HlyC/CorC family transporter [Syntrophomonadaceae bacterium]
MEVSPSLSLILSIIKILAAILLVLLNALFVAAEFAFVRVRPTRIAQLASEGNNKAKVTEKCIENIDAYLSVSQLGITLASLGLGWLGEPAVADLLTPLLFSWGLVSPTLVHSISFLLAFGTITFLHVVFGELAPKSLAIQRAETLSLWLARPMHMFFYIFYPAVVLLNGTANKIVMLLGFKAVYESNTHSEEELRMIISESYREGQIKKSEQELLQNVFRFEQRVAEEIMVPRPEVVFLDINNSWEDNLKLAKEGGHTRFPVIDGSPDRIVGLVNIKDVIYNEKIQNLNDIKREIMFVPAGMPLDKLLAEFQQKHQHMAAVLDEYGGTAGIVTLENVLEELVGEIQDEFDEEEPEIVFEEDHTLLVSGRMFLNDAAERFGLSVGEEEQYYTLAGFLLGKLGRRPREGDIIKEGNLQMEIARMRGMRIDRIRISPAPEKKDTGNTKH